MSNCICGVLIYANNLKTVSSQNQFSLLFLSFKDGLNKCKSWHNFKMKTPKKIFQLVYSKSPLKVSFQLHVLPSKYQWENKVFQNSQFITSAGCILSHILATTSPRLPPGSQWTASPPHTGHLCWASWCLAMGGCLVLPP